MVFKMSTTAPKGKLPIEIWIETGETFGSFDPVTQKAGDKYTEYYVNLYEEKDSTKYTNSSVIEEIKPALLELYDEYGCHCGYYDEEDEDGEAVMSICAACFIKSRINPPPRLEAGASFSGEGENNG